MPPTPPTPPTPILPVLSRRADIESAIASHQVVVLCGATGSGKTTQLPQICLEMGLGVANSLSGGVIAHTQPRRLAARAVAARIAEERNVRLGGLVGVKVRFQDQTGRDTRIKLMTDGLLLAELAGDPLLREYSVIIIDEAHERSLNVDFLLGYLRNLLPRRPDLKLIITSATIDPARFSNAFGGPTLAPVVEVSGRTFPVEIRYRPHSNDTEGAEVNIHAVSDAIAELMRPSAPAGDCLVFLPGEREIRLIDAHLRRERIDAEVLPLFSRLSNQEQDRIFHPTPGKRRVILATNVAETSLTVPNIASVVDCGLARISRYDPKRKVQSLPIEAISRSSADQRAGRCGRIAAGVCVRLYSESSFNDRPLFTDPEIKRTNLASVILQLMSLGEATRETSARASLTIESFPFLDPPDSSGIRDGYETLFELGAITHPDASGAITPIGRAMSRIPVEPRIARMLLAGEREGALREVLVLAAALSIQDPRERPMGRQDEADRVQTIFRHESSDFLSLLKLWDQYTHAGDERSAGALFSWCREHYLSANRMREWGEMHAQLSRIVEDLGLEYSEDTLAGGAHADSIHRALLTGLIANVACREAEGGSFDYRSVRAGVAQIFPGSVLFKKGPKWIVAAEMVETTRLYARTVAKIDAEWIEDLAGHMFRRQITDPHWDPEAQDAGAWERVTLSGIVVVPRRRVPLALSNPAKAREILIRDGLVHAKLVSDALPVLDANRDVMSSARIAEAKLRARNIVASEDALHAWFEARLSPEICTTGALFEWARRAPEECRAVLGLTLRDALASSAYAALDQGLFPDALQVGAESDHPPCALTYALAPGKDHDGVTLSVPIEALSTLPPTRVPWLVPGMLEDLILSLLKQLPKPQRAALESIADLTSIARDTCAVLAFAKGDLPVALSEALNVLHEMAIAPTLWSFKGLPAHLRLRVRVIDAEAKEIACDRDLEPLLERCKGRIAKAGAARARDRFDRAGITTWDFGVLPEGVEAATTDRAAYPALIDEGTTVRLSLLESPLAAQLHTARGVRLLFALACKDEIQHQIDALPAWNDIARQFSSLGTNDELRADLARIIAERTFMFTQAPVRSREQFDDRIDLQRGRLAVTAREVGETIARVLEARAKTAHRLAGGTPRLWAASIADIREHAAYLMPRGFLGNVPWERLRNYPRYAETMRERLFALREAGSKAETDALAQIAPHWKRFTGFVASGMSAESQAIAAGDAEAPALATGKSARPGKAKAPLPQTRRSGPSVNLDAGEWAMRPGNLNLAMVEFRWTLEDARAEFFAIKPSARAAQILKQLDEQWKKASAD